MIGTSLCSAPRVSPYGCGDDDGLISGSISRGIPKNDNSSSSQSRVSRSISIVRLALVTSVMCTPPSGPPVRFHTTQLSAVPNTASPLCAAARTPSTFSRIHCSFAAEK